MALELEQKFQCHVESGKQNHKPCGLVQIIWTLLVTVFILSSSFSFLENIHSPTSTSSGIIGYISLCNNIYFIFFGRYIKPLCLTNSSFPSPFLKVESLQNQDRCFYDKPHITHLLVCNRYTLEDIHYKTSGSTLGFIMNILLCVQTITHTEGCYIYYIYHIL